MTLKKTKTMQDLIQCPGTEGRVEGGLCTRCDTDHTMTFEFYRQKVEDVIDKWSKDTEQKQFIDELKRELGV